jgi:hypothetical protein
MSIRLVRLRQAQAKSAKSTRAFTKTWTLEWHRDGPAVPRHLHLPSGKHQRIGTA